MKEVVAIQKYSPDHGQDYISFNAGQVITVQQKFPNGWWYGGFTKEGRDIKGFFPSTYVKEESSAPRSPPPEESEWLSYISG